MSFYIPYTQAERDRAYHTDLTALLRSQGEALKRSGTEYEWHVGGQKVTIRGHLWYHLAGAELQPERHQIQDRR